MIYQFLIAAYTLDGLRNHVSFFFFLNCSLVYNHFPTFSIFVFDDV